MSRVLCAWELGGGYGHIAALSPVAQRLRARGHDVVLAIKDLFYAERILGAAGLDYVQAPVWQHPPRDLPDPVNYAEMLFHVGYLEASVLTGLVKAWRNLYRLVQPELLLVDHAPTALLAARGLGLRTASLGTGFFIPPDRTPMPSMRPWLQLPDARLLAGETRALAEINRVLATLALPPLTRLTELLAVDRNFLATFPELDHYGARAGADYCGPRFLIDEGVAPDWPPGDGPRVFAYLKPQHRDFPAVVAALRRTACRALVHAPGLAAPDQARLGGGNVRFSARALRMDQAAAQADLAICHAGHGSVAALLLAGCPLLLLPMQLEQTLVARRVFEMGAGRVVEQGAPAPDYERWLGELLVDRQMRAHAAAFAARHADFEQARQLENLVTQCETLLAR